MGQRYGDDYRHPGVEIRSCWQIVAISIVLCVVGVGLVLAGWDLTVEAAIIVGFVVGVRAAAEVAATLLTRVRVDQLGITVVKPGRDVVVPWGQVVGLDIRCRGRQRVIAVKRHLNQDLVLPAPKAGAGRFDNFDLNAATIAHWYRACRPHDAAITEGPMPARKTFSFWLVCFIVVAVFLDSRPWESFWWPGSQEAVATPQPCGPVAQELRALGVDTPGREGQGPESAAEPAYRSCRWSGTPRTDGGYRFVPARSIEVAYDRHPRFLLDDGSSTSRAQAF